MRSSKINIINSPSPNDGVFLLILFISGVPKFFEIKTFPNDKETIFRNFTNEWLITKKEFTIDRNIQDINIEFNCENKNGFITESVGRYLNGGSFSNILHESTRTRKTFEDPLVEIFEPDELEEEINFPLQRVRMRSELDNHYMKKSNTDSETLTISSSKGSGSIANFNNSKHGRHTSHMEFKNVKKY